MSVLIKGMEMPEDRPQLLWVYPNGKALTVQSDVDPWKNLQAIPVPSHGRCIDVDAMIKELTLDDEDDNSGASLLMAIFLEVLKAAPTIIEAEEGNDGSSD